MIDLQKYLYDKVKEVMETWDYSDAYSVTFFVYSNEGYEYKDYSNISEFNISLNNETYFRKNYRYNDDGLDSEERWNYAFLETDETFILDDEALEVLFDWYKQEGIENIGYEDDNCEDGPVGYPELLKVITEVAKQMIEEDFLLEKCGKRIPIIIQDYEFCDCVVEATKEANIHGEAKDFLNGFLMGNF